MDPLSASAASGMRSRIEALELLANNLANTNTAGYKADREFYSLYTTAGDPGEAAAALPVVEAQWTDFGQGPAMPTSNPLDVAIEGEGFFSIQTRDNQTLLTRNGNFRLNSSGELITSTGDRVIDRTGTPIRLDPTTEISILQDGTVQQGGKTTAQIGVVMPARLQDLAKAGANYFRIADVKGLVQRAEAARIHQGRLEAANGNPAEQSVRLVSIMRQFEMLQRAASIGAEMNKRSIEEVARVNS